MNPFNFSEDQVLLFILMFVRVGGMIFFTPILGGANVPHHAKISLAFFVTLMVLPLVDFKFVEYPKGLFSFALLISSELLIGMIIGFSVRLLMSAVQIAGTTVGFQMGFGIVNVIDPVTSLQVSVIAQFQNLVGYLIFLSINAHHIILNSIASSFQLIPPLGFEFSREMVNIYMNIVRDVFVISVKIAGPLIATLLFTSVALGMIARTVPQMNVFIVGFPLQIGLGLLMIGLTLPLFSMVINNIAGMIEQNIFALLKAM